MYNSLKKLSITFMILNVFTFQSLMADMIFYYSAAILPSIVASQNQAHAEPIANHDDASASDLIPVTVDVLGNDTIDEGLIVTVQLGAWDDATGNLLYVADEVVTSEGTWSVEANQSVTFTPGPTYAGGGVHIFYEITDHDGHSSTNDIFINYPELLQVSNISINEADVTAATTVNVLDSVILTGGETVAEILIQNGWNQGVPTYGTYLQLAEGNWTVVGNEVVFTPNASFGGGSVYKDFKVIDSAGRILTRQIEIIYPLYLRAESDGVNPLVIEPVVIDVLANDITANGAYVTTVRLEQYGGVYTETADVLEGSWYVDLDNNVTFTPNANFSGGTVQMWYQITDQYEHTSKNWINIEYPAFLQAFHDEVTKETIEPVNMDILANDTIVAGSTITLTLESWDYGSLVYTETMVDTNDGTWMVEANQTITFTPSPTFGGGNAWMTYQITDQDGHTSQIDIGIIYPLYVRAEYDQVDSLNIEPITVNVLENDVNTSAVTVLIETYENGYPEYLPTVNANDGTWNVEANQSVTFTPNANFVGGQAWINYQITDQDGYVSRNWIDIQYPVIIYAEFDDVSTDTLAPINVNVLENDTIAAGVIATVQLFQYWDNNGPVYANPIDAYEGTWTVETNQSVTFAPNANFNGGDVWGNYDLTDQNGHVSSASIHILFPIVIQANYDSIESADIVTVTVDVLANDILQDGATLTSLLIETGYDNVNEQFIYGTTIQQDEGNWTVVDDEVVFTPNSSFAGGYVDKFYQITDDQGHTTVATVNIQYPEFLRAEADFVVATDVTLTTTVNVLDNDFISPYVTLESIWLANYDQGAGQWTVATQIETNDGNWTVVTNEVVFTPSADFTGGAVDINYQLRDVEGHMTVPYAGYVTITYPLGATPVCTRTPLVDLSSVYDATVESMSFLEDNGGRSFEARLDTDNRYTIDSQLFTDTATVTSLNPMYMIEYQEFVGSFAELRTTEIELIESNTTWNYFGQKVKNDNGIKTINSEGDSGNYTLDIDGSYVLNIGIDPVFNFKAVQEIASLEMMSILSGASVDLALVEEDTAQLILTKSLADRYWWNGYSPTQWEPAYAGLNEYILTKEYNSSNTEAINTVLYASNGAGILFGVGSSGSNTGNLVEINSNDNTLLTDTAGTWSIETITDEDITYNVLILEPTLCGYNRTLYRLQEDGNIYSGGQEETMDQIGAEISYSESLKNKLETFFIENASLDINASTP